MSGYSKYFKAIKAPPFIGAKHILKWWERRFPKATFEHQNAILFKRCRWCKRGDLAWDVCYEEWYCLMCGWREYEKTRGGE